MSLERLAFDLVVSKLDTQRQDVMALRQQARATATITGLVGAVFAAFLGPSELSSALQVGGFLGISLPALVLTVCFVGSLTFSCMVLVHWHKFTFSFDAVNLLKNRKIRRDDNELFSDYAEAGEDHFFKNEKCIERLQSKLFFATVLGWVQIFPWYFLILEARVV